jgi:uncharacterized protein (TIGR02147 family)
VKLDGDYRQMLRRELETRCQRNPRYSLRAFARDIGLSPSRLSHVLGGRFGLSRAAAAQIAARLSWPSRQRELFCVLVESQHARSNVRRQAAQARLKGLHAHYRALDDDSFRVIADWYHFALLELVNVEGFVNDDRWISRALRISIHEARAARARLLRLGMLREERGRLRAEASFFANPGGDPSESIRKAHRQLLEKATLALAVDSVDQREFQGLLLGFDTSLLKEVKASILDFRDGFDSRFGAACRKDSVYALTIQFFKVAEPPTPSEEANERD